MTGWARVDDQLAALLLASDRALDDALSESAAAGLPEIGVSALQGRLLELLARISGASSILELDPGYAEIARANVSRAGLGDVVQVRVGPAAERLAELVEAGEGPFDLIFIDADKRSNPDYLEWSLRLSRPGTVIVADNVIRAGAVADPADDDPSSIGVKRFLELVGAEPRLTATARSRPSARRAGTAFCSPSSAERRRRGRSRRWL